jgi:hypothetical protein
MSKKDLSKALDQLWPAVQGSITSVRKPCIKKGCKACLSGEKHAATIFTYWDGKKQRCMYVPQGMVEELKQALDNGRKLEKAMKEMGPCLIREYRKKQEKER